MRIGFIGMGNMARAIVEGWLRAGTVCAEDVGAVAKRFDRLNAYARETGICAMPFGARGRRMGGYDRDRRETRCGRAGDRRMRL